MTSHRTLRAPAHVFRAMASAFAVLICTLAIASSEAPQDAADANLLKLDDTISVNGGDLKVEQTETGGIRITGSNEREGAVFYFGKTFRTPQKIVSLEVEITGLEKPVLAIVRDEKGSTANQIFRPDSGDNSLDIEAMRFSGKGQEEVFAGKVDKIAFTITKPVGDFVIEVSNLVLRR